MPAPLTSGMAREHAASETRYRVAGRSVQSRTRSWPCKSDSAVDGRSGSVIGVYETCGFSLLSVRYEENCSRSESLDSALRLVHPRSAAVQHLPMQV